MRIADALLRRPGLAAGILVAAVAAISAAPSLARPVDWTPDGYFYEAQTLEVRGASAQAARATVFSGSLTEARRARERATLAPADRRVANPAWVDYSAPFFRRRWLVPAAAAAVRPLFGTRSLELVSVLGYVAAAVALYGLLRFRFSPAVAGIAAAAASLVPQYRTSALEPLTDSWGVALEAACLLLALAYLRTRRRTLALAWPLAVLALAFTRDNAFVVAVAVLALGVRSRAALKLGAAGLVAALVPSLVFGTHYRVLLAYTLDNSHIPPSTSWSWSLHHYWGGVEKMLRGFATPLRHGVPPVTGLALLVGLVALVALGRAQGRFQQLLLASAAASALFLLSLPQEGFRITFVLLPAAAAGYALLVELAAALRPAGHALRLRRQIR